MPPEDYTVDEYRVVDSDNTNVLNELMGAALSEIPFEEDGIRQIPIAPRAPEQRTTRTADPPPNPEMPDGWKGMLHVSNLISEVTGEEGFQNSDYGFRDDLEKIDRDLTYAMSHELVPEFEILPAFKELNGIHLYNLSPNIKFNMRAQDIESMLANDCRKCYLRDIESGSTINNMFSVLTVGNSNIVVCVISRHGKPYFVSQVVRLIWATTGKRSETKTILKKCLQFTRDQRSKYVDVEGDGLAKDVLTSTLMKLIKSGTAVNARNLNEFLTSVNNGMKSLFEPVPDRGYSTNSQARPNAIHYSLLKNQNNVYRRALEKIITARARLAKDAYARGLSIGMKLFSELARAGYKYNEKTRRWEKEMALEPTMCYKDSKLWQILPEFRVYKITKLSITADDFAEMSNSFHMRAEGSHPNVNSSGNVCLGGDMNSRWHRIVTSDAGSGEKVSAEVFEYLMDIEETLEIPNFDSAYKHMDDFESKVISAVRDHTAGSKRGTERKWTELE